MELALLSRRPEGSSPAREKAALTPAWAAQPVLAALAPRHLDRVDEVVGLLQARGIPFARWSERKGRSEPLADDCRLLLIDTHGELRSVYAASDLAFVGGSLIPRGGHNIMEPAWYGVPVVSGSHLRNFQEESALFRQEDALLLVEKPDDLRDALARFLADPAPFRAAGQRGRRLLERLSGTAGRTLAALDRRGLLPAWPATS